MTTAYFHPTEILFLIWSRNFRQSLSFGILIYHIFCQARNWSVRANYFSQLSAKARRFDRFQVFDWSIFNSSAHHRWMLRSLILALTIDLQSHSKKKAIQQIQHFHARGKTIRYGDVSIFKQKLNFIIIKDVYYRVSQKTKDNKSQDTQTCRNRQTWRVCCSWILHLKLSLRICFLLSLMGHIQSVFQDSKS